MNERTFPQIKQTAQIDKVDCCRSGDYEHKSRNDYDCDYAHEHEHERGNWPTNLQSANICAISGCSCRSF